MTLLATLIERLADQGFAMLLVITGILALGGIAVAAARAPVHRQRLAELTVGAALVWFVLALLPLPRLALPGGWSGGWSAAEAPRVAAPLAAGVTAATPARAAPTDLRGTRLQLGMEPAAPAGGAAGPGRPGDDPHGAAASGPTALPPAAAPRPWLVFAYLASLGLGLAWLALGVAVLAVAWARSRPAPREAQSLAARLAAGQLRGTPRLRISAGRVPPFCFALLRPTIFVPGELLAPGARDRLAAVLHHELAHLAHRDTRGRLLFAFAQVLLAPHPLFWWLRREAHLAAELLADDVAAGATGTARYAHEMIDLAAMQAQWRPPLLAAVPAFHTRSEFYRRMKMLLQREDRLAVSCSPLRSTAQLGVAGVVVAFASACFGVEALPAQEKGQPEVQQELKVLQDQREALQAELVKLRAEVSRLKVAGAEQDPNAGVIDQLVREGKAAELKRNGDGVNRGAALRAAGKAAPEGAEANPLFKLLEAQRAQEVGGQAAEEGAAPGFQGRAALEQMLVARAANGAAGAARNANPFGAVSTGRVQERDVLGMVNGAIDLGAELETAKTRLARLEQLRDSGNATDDQRDEARIKLDSLVRKHKAVQTMLDAERRATEVELQSALAQRGETKDGTREASELDARTVRLEARMKAMQLAR